MSLIDKETEDKFRQELESFIEQKKAEFSNTQNPEMLEKFESSMQKMRMQMEQLLIILQMKDEEN